MTPEEQHSRAARNTRRKSTADPTPVPPAPPLPEPPAPPAKAGLADAWSVLDTPARVTALCTVIAAFFGGIAEVVRIATGH